MKILMFPQNELHLTNLLPIADILDSKDIHVLFLDASAIFRQDIFLNQIRYERIVISGKQKNGFYYLSKIDQIKTILKLKRDFVNLLVDFDYMIICNDGSVQRLAMSIIGSKNTILLLDSIISNYLFSFMDVLIKSENKFRDSLDWFKKKLRRNIKYIAGVVPFGFLLPSEIGQTRVDKVFVCGKFNADVMQQLGSLNKKNVFITGIPRFDKLYGDIKYSSDNSKNYNQVLVITQAYKWHGEYYNDVLQHEEIRKLITLVAKIKESSFKIRIRIHPRDDKNNYIKYLVNEHVSISEGKPLINDIAKSNLIVGFNSTVLIESLFFKKPILILMTHNQYWRFKYSFISHIVFEKLFTQDELYSYLRKFKPGNQEYPQKYLDYFVANTTRTSPEVIANILLPNSSNI